MALTLSAWRETPRVGDSQRLKQETGYKNFKEYKKLCNRQRKLCPQGLQLLGPAPPAGTKEGDRKKAKAGKGKGELRMRRTEDFTHS